VDPPHTRFRKGWAKRHYGQSVRGKGGEKKSSEKRHNPKGGCDVQPATVVGEKQPSAEMRLKKGKKGRGGGRRPTGGRGSGPNAGVSVPGGVTTAITTPLTFLGVILSKKKKKKRERKEKRE